MKKLFIFLIVAGILAYGALNYHFIRTDSGLRILKKAALTLEDTYVDARGGNKAKLFLNPALVDAGIRDFLGKQGIRVEK